MWSLTRRQCVLQLLSKSIEQLRQPSAHLQESEEEQEEPRRELQMESMQEERVPPGGVIRKHTLSSSSSSGSSSELPDGHYGVIKVKEEPADSEDEALAGQSLESEQSTYLHQVKGRLVIRAMIWKGKTMRSHTRNIRRNTKSRRHPRPGRIHTHTHLHTQSRHRTVGQLSPSPYMSPFSLSCSLSSSHTLRPSVCDLCVVISVKYVRFTFLCI